MSGGSGHAAQLLWRAPPPADVRFSRRSAIGAHHAVCDRHLVEELSRVDPHTHFVAVDVDDDHGIVTDLQHVAHLQLEFVFLHADLQVSSWESVLITKTADPCATQASGNDAELYHL